MPSKYRKKPVVIVAMQYTEENRDNVVEWCNQKGTRNAYVKGGNLVIETLEGDHKANLGDFIIQGVSSEFYPCKPGIFKKTYEKVNKNKIL